MTDHHPAASLGKRLLPAIALTASAAGLVVLLDRPPSGSAIDGRGDGAASPDAAPDTAAGASPILPPTTIPPPTTTPTPTVAPAVPVPSPSPTIAPPRVSSTTVPAAKQPAPAAAATCEGQTIDGPTVNTRWGPVQVEAVVSSSGQICDVDAIQSPNSHGRSVAINNAALPILHRQVMKAQSTNINGVSGATITSTGYVRSLQAILDRVGG
jgi:uncharacterized protein with FMN-binding domain